MHPTSIIKRFAIAAVLGSQLLASAFAGGSEVNKSAQGVAIQGYDPVAYFTQGKPVVGNAAYHADWQGARWQFYSAANRDAFNADPHQYAPQYGGYCAVGTKMGIKLDIQPDQFKIVDNKLYLNSSAKAHGMWLEDIPGFIEGADKNWPKIKHRTAAELKAALGKS